MMVDFIKKSIFKREHERLATLEREKEERIQRETDQRVATAVAKIDPFELMMEQYHGIFSKEYAHVEDPLDAHGQLSILSWAHQAHHSAGFKHLTQWIMNTQGNETLKKAVVTPDRILYGRAQISCMLLFVKEVQRLATAYDEMTKEVKGFDSALAAE